MSLNADIQRYVDQAKHFVLNRIPEDRNQRIYLAAGTLTVAGVVLYPLLHHAVLGRQVSHTYPNASVRQASLDCGEISSIPKDLVESPRKYKVVHDKVVTQVHEVTVTADLEKNFTKLLRHQFIQWAKSPQGWIIWFYLRNSPQLKESFSKEHIEDLDFVEGDRVDGIFEVVKRTPLRVEIRVTPPPTGSPVTGLQVIALRPRNEGAALVSETIQWAKKDANVTLPLESFIARFLHSWTSRSLSLSGADYLRSINV